MLASKYAPNLSVGQVVSIRQSSVIASIEGASQRNGS